jgi:trk system potassium uptake protein TrkH
MHLVPKQFSPAQVLALSLAALIAFGTLLLWVPAAGARGGLTLIDAFFTATSAVCVTGLIVVDTPNDLTLFGQIVLLALVQVGGLGYMAITTIVAVAVGRSLSVQERATVQEALNISTVDGVLRFAVKVLRFTLFFELAGAVLLTARWAPDMGIARAAYHGVFHSVSAFFGAGFALHSDSLLRYRTDPVVNAVIGTLIVAGGLGFVVLAELLRRTRTQRISVHTRLVLVMTAVLVPSAAILIFLLERGNPATLGPLSTLDAAMASLFHAVTPRSAGFLTIDLSGMLVPTHFLIMILMFIGGAPGGATGGVKVTTFAITVAALWATMRGAEEPVIFKRRIPAELVARAFFICLIAFLSVNVVAAILLVTEGRDLLPTLFEVVSAFGTVGLSTAEAGSPLSLTGHFTTTGKLLIAALIFVGRIGPLTLAVALAQRRTRPRIRHAEGKILIG